MKKLIVSVVVGVGLVASVAPCAQDLADPTRPATFKAPQVDSGPAAIEAPVTALKGIWAVGSRRYASLNGETVEIGSKFGDKRVTQITDTTVTLRGGAGNETLSLVTGIDRKDRTAAPEPPPPSNSKRKRSTEK